MALINSPVKPEDVKIVPGGHSGNGLQITCPCGCVNWSHIEISDPIWKCRNCGRIFTQYYPGLVRQVRARHQQGSPAETPTAPG